MTWIVRIVKFRNKLIHECQLKKDWSDKLIKELTDESDCSSDQLCAPEVIETFITNLEDNDYVAISNNNGWQLRSQGTSSANYWSA
jgi:hypothetical protein